MGDISDVDTNYTGHESQDIWSCQVVCTDLRDSWPCIVVLKDEVMQVDEWYNNELQDLITIISMHSKLSEMCLGHAQPY